MNSPAHVLTAGLDVRMQQRISAWFKTYNFLPPLSLYEARIDHLNWPHATLEGLMKAMIVSTLRNFILIIHGYSDGVGLYLKLSNDQNSPHKPHTTYDDLQRLIREDVKGSRPSSDDLAHMNVRGSDAT